MKLAVKRFSQKIVGEGLVRVLSAVLIFWLARYLGAEGFGTYASALAFATLFAIFIDLGTNSVLTRSMARAAGQHETIIRTGHFLKLLAVCGTTLLLLGSVFILNLSATQRLLTIGLGIVIISQALIEYYCALLTGAEEMGWEATLKAATRLCVIGPALAAIALNRSLLTITLWMAAGAVVAIGIAEIILRLRLGGYSWRYEPARIRALLMSSLPIWFSVIFWVFYDNQDILILNAFQIPQAEVGYFAAAAKVLDVIKVFPVLLVSVFFPTLSRLAHGDRSEFWSKTRRVAGYLLIGVTGIAVSIYWAAPLVIQTLYKQDFTPAVPYLRWLVPAFVGIGVNHLMLYLLIALNQERFILKASAAACLGNAGLACLWIPQAGALGACWALVSSEVIFAAFLSFRFFAIRTVSHER